MVGKGIMDTIHAQYQWSLGRATPVGWINTQATVRRSSGAMCGSHPPLLNGSEVKPEKGRPRSATHARVYKPPGPPNDIAGMEAQISGSMPGSNPPPPMSADHMEGFASRI